MRVFFVQCLHVVLLFVVWADRAAAQKDVQPAFEEGRQFAQQN
jgi:hypothetical protein